VSRHKQQDLLMPRHATKGAQGTGCDPQKDCVAAALFLDRLEGTVRRHRGRPVRTRRSFRLSVRSSVDWRRYALPSRFRTIRQRSKLERREVFLDSRGRSEACSVLRPV